MPQTPEMGYIQWSLLCWFVVSAAVFLLICLFGFFVPTQQSVSGTLRWLWTTYPTTWIVPLGLLIAFVIHVFLELPQSK